jgi:hypothetical protein
MIQLHTPKVLGPVVSGLVVHSVAVQAVRGPKETSFQVVVSWTPHDGTGKALSAPQNILASGDDARALLAAMTSDPIPVAESLLLAAVEAAPNAPTLGPPSPPPRLPSRSPRFPDKLPSKRPFPGTEKAVSPSPTGKP